LRQGQRGTLERIATINSLIKDDDERRNIRVRKKIQEEVSNYQKNGNKLEVITRSADTILKTSYMKLTRNEGKADRQRYMELKRLDFDKTENWELAQRLADEIVFQLRISRTKDTGWDR
jgi:hypothetical protein